LIDKKKTGLNINIKTDLFIDSHYGIFNIKIFMSTFWGYEQVVSSEYSFLFMKHRKTADLAPLLPESGARMWRSEQFI